MTRELRSARWFATDDLAGLQHRAFLRSLGRSEEGLFDRPVIGICNGWSELVNCNVQLAAVASAVKRGVLRAGGVPLEFTTMSLGEQFMKPTAMLYRNLMAMDVEETIRANPLDAVVLLGGCDKTVPAQLMGAVSAGLPCIAVVAGPRLAVQFGGSALASGSDLWRLTDDRRAGRITEAEYALVEEALAPSPGTCMELGTASTMAAMTEALGLALPGSATPGAMHARRLAVAEESGARAVALATDGGSPREILTREAFENAFTVLGALGGAPNAVLHLLAIAGRAQVELSRERIDEMLRATPRLVNVKPLGSALFEDVGRAGGVPAVMRELLPLLHPGAPTITGRTVRENVREAASLDAEIIRPLDSPFAAVPSVGFVHGSLAVNGAVVRPEAFPEHLRRHEGPIVVFDGLDDMLRRLEDPDEAIDDRTILVLRGIGPRGGHGMPEWGLIPIPTRLLEAGVTDMVRLSDGRTSGTAAGAVVAHVDPEGVVDGPLAAVGSGDRVKIDVLAGRLDLLVDQREIKRRLDARPPRRPIPGRGYQAIYANEVLGASQGCDFRSLRGGSSPDETLPAGLDTGWLAGW